MRGRTLAHSLLVGLFALSYSCSKGSSNSSEETPNNNDDSPPAVDMNTDAGKLILGTALTDTVQGSDLPTIFLDVTRDVSTVILTPTDPTVSNVLSLSLGTDFSLAEQAGTIVSNLGGKASFNGDISETEKTGSFALTDFMARPGFPSLTSGTLTFDLDTSSAAMTGKVTGKDIIFSKKTVSMDADYNLYKDSGFWRGTMSGTLYTENGNVEFSYDYDTPILGSVTVVALDHANKEISGSIVNGGKARLKVTANSNSPLNWINTAWDSPNSNLEGGGGSVSYCRYGQCGSPSESTFREESPGYWTYYRDFEVSEYQPSGTYTWTISVKNTSMLSSREKATTIKVSNALSSDAAIIHSAILDTDAGLTSGTGGQVTLHLVVDSVAPADWVNVTLDGPTLNIEGGGGSATFDDCDLHTSTSGHACFGLTGNYQYYTRTWTISKWAPNGTYTFSTITVKNAADLTSEPVTPALTFAVAGNTVATTPVITGIDMYYNPSDPSDPANTGTLLTDNTCLETTAVGTSLTVALVITATSNAPVNWINTTFNGPTENLEGGGGGITASDMGSNTWQVIKPTTIDDPLNAPQGTYKFESMSVANEGELTSSSWTGGLSFHLKATCP